LIGGEPDDRVGIVKAIHQRGDGLAIRQALAQPDRSRPHQWGGMVNGPKRLRRQTAAAGTGDHRADQTPCIPPPHPQRGILPAVILTALSPSLEAGIARQRPILIPGRGEL
jgi:hypothetical protein